MPPRQSREENEVLLIVMSALWVLASAGVAMMPVRRQYVPGVALMLAAPVLIWFWAIEFGWLLGGVALFAFVSMFRNPLLYMARRLLGHRPETPT